MLQAAKRAKDEKRDPSRMLRVLAFLAAPVFYRLIFDHLIPLKKGYEKIL